MRRPWSSWRGFWAHPAESAHVPNARARYHRPVIMSTVPPPPAVSRCNCLVLRQTARHVSAFYDAMLAPSGLRGTQFSIVAALADRPPQTVGELAEHMVMDRTTLARNLKPLERDGLVAITVGDDRRERRVALSARGRDKLAEAMPYWRTAQKRFEQRFGYDNARQMRETLGRVMHTELTD
jgi:DNA-binding MarR family transcriptional regulator